MKTIASTWTLLLVCAGCGVLSLGFGSCGSSSNGTEAVPDSGARDTGSKDVSTSVDSAVAFDSSGGFEGGATDASAPDAGDEAGSCGQPLTGHGTACDGCIATNCEPIWCACAGDPVDVDGGPGCLQYVTCVEGCVATDAGSPSDCLTSVCAVSPFTTSEQQAGHSFVDCQVQYCASECGQ